MVQILISLLITLAMSAFGGNGAFGVPGPSPGNEAGAFYGVQERPLVDHGTRLNVYGPEQRTIIRINESTIEVPLADHLSSVRVVAGEDSTHHEYGPYGVTADRTSNAVYAGHPYDASQDAYATPSRWYDAPSGRFLSRDPIPGLSNPYSYTNSNPVNQLDPDGRATTYFFLWSRIDSMAHYPNGQTAWRYHEIMRIAIDEHRLPVTGAELEVSAETPFHYNPGTGRHHLTIMVPGAPGGRVAIADTAPGRITNMTGPEFASYLSLRMRQQFGNASDHLRSISLFRCQNACRRPSGGPVEPSFAEDFARVARPHFPRLREVIVSPYEIDAVELRREGLPSEVGLRVPANADRESIILSIDPQQLLGGNFPEDLFHRPTPSMIYGVNELVPTPGHPDRTHLQFSSDSNRIHSFMDLHRNELTEPILRSIPIEAPIVEPPVE